MAARGNFFKKSMWFGQFFMHFRFSLGSFWEQNWSEVWFVPINRLWKLYLKRKPRFSLFCKLPPVWEKYNFSDRKLPGGIFEDIYWKNQLNIYQDVIIARTHHPDRQSHFIILDVIFWLRGPYNIRNLFIGKHKIHIWKHDSRGGFWLFF